MKVVPFLHNNYIFLYTGIDMDPDTLRQILDKKDSTHKNYPLNDILEGIAEENLQTPQESTPEYQPTDQPHIEPEYQPSMHEMPIENEYQPIAETPVTDALPQSYDDPTPIIPPHSTEHHNPQVIIHWEAPVRAYKRKSAGVLKFYFAIAILLTIIVMFLQYLVMIVPIWAIMFLVYAFTVSEPVTTTNAITKFGLKSGKLSFPWEHLSYFYFLKKFDYNVMIVVTKDFNAHPLYFVIPHDETKEAILMEMSKHIMYQDNPKKTLTDKAAEWMTSLMPEDDDQAVA